MCFPKNLLESFFSLLSNFLPSMVISKSSFLCKSSMSHSCKLLQSGIVCRNKLPTIFFEVSFSVRLRLEDFKNFFRGLSLTCSLSNNKITGCIFSRMDICLRCICSYIFYTDFYRYKNSRY